MAQDPQIEGTGSLGSIILGILDIQSSSKMRSEGSKNPVVSCRSTPMALEYEAFGPMDVQGQQPYNRNSRPNTHIMNVELSTPWGSKYPKVGPLYVFETPKSWRADRG